MYFELKVFTSGDTTKIEFDSSAPFANDANSIIRTAPPDAKQIRDLLLHVADQLIPRVVARDYSVNLEIKPGSKYDYKDYNINKNLYTLESKHRDEIKKIITKYTGDGDNFCKAMISYIDSNELPLQTTRFNFENANAALTSQIRSVVNGDIPPSKRT